MQNVRNDLEDITVKLEVKCYGLKGTRNLEESVTIWIGVYYISYEVIIDSKFWLKAKYGDLGFVLKLIKRITWDWTVIWWLGHNRSNMK